MFITFDANHGNLEDDIGTDIMEFLAETHTVGFVDPEDARICLPAVLLVICRGSSILLLVCCVALRLSSTLLLAVLLPMMPMRSWLLLCVFILASEAHWWWKTKTVTCTVTSTKTVEQCTSRCSSFGRQPCTTLSHSTISHTASRTTITPTTSSQKSSSTPRSSKRSTSTTTPTRSTSTTPESLRTSTPTRAQTTSSTSTRSSSTVPSSSRSVSQSTSKTQSSTRRPSTSHPSFSASSSSISSASSTTPSNPGSSVSFFIRAQTSQNEANGQYAVVSSANRLEFTSPSPDGASRFTLSSGGSLLYNSIAATVAGATGGAGVVQFLPGSTKEKRQAAAGTPLTCIVTANVNGAAVLECAADASTLQQACGVGFYLGSPPAACQPLVLAQIIPGSAAATTNNPTPVNPAPGAQFSLQANGPPFNFQDTTSNFAIYTSVAGGLTGFTFTRFGSGVPLSLDSNGHLVGVGPTASGQNVAYAATFKIGSTFGPVALMSGTIDSAYVPIICCINCLDAGDGPFGCQMQCRDGANGANMQLQTCGSALNLGTSVNTAAGCRQPAIAVYYTGS